MSIAPEGSDERTASTGDLYGAGSYFASQACKTLQSCDDRPPRFEADLPNEERSQCLRTQHTRLVSVQTHTVLSKRAPKDMLLAFRGAHPPLPKQ